LLEVLQFQYRVRARSANSLGKAFEELNIAGIFKDKANIVLRKDVIYIGKPEDDLVQRQLETVSQTSELGVDEVAVTAEFNGAQQGVGQN
jgi:hypothetical protein